MPHSEGDGHTTHEIAKEAMDLTNQTQVQMDIKELAYFKSNIRIKKGTTVTWTNQDDIQHNVMLEHEGSDRPHDPPTREQVDPNEFAAREMNYKLKKDSGRHYRQHVYCQRPFTEITSLVH